MKLFYSLSVFTGILLSIYENAVKMHHFETMAKHVVGEFSPASC